LWPTSSNSFKPWTPGNIKYGIEMANAEEADKGHLGRPEEMFARARALEKEELEGSEESDIANWIKVT